MQERQRLKLLAIVVAGFVIPAITMVALQFLPATAGTMSYLFAPYHAGILMQLMLLVIAGLAILGEVPRWSIALPISVWLAGGAYWWVERGRTLERIHERAKPIDLVGTYPPLVVTGMTYLAANLAQNLIADYQIDEVYAQLTPSSQHYRYRIAVGEACRQSAENRVRQPWQPARLKAANLCVVRDQTAAPAGGVEVKIEAHVQSNPTNDRAYTPLRFSARAAADAALTQIDVVAERGPLPLLLPVVGCWVTPKTAGHNCVTGLARSPFLISMVPAAAPFATSIFSPMPIADTAYYVGGALGFKRRDLLSAASAQ